MEFNPSNSIVKLCLQGMAEEEKSNATEAGKLFLQAWNEATNDFEKFLAAFYLARRQNNPSEKLTWLESTLKFAKRMNDETVSSAYNILYTEIARCYERLSNLEKAQEFHELVKSTNEHPSDKGPFYHGTKADLKPGDLLTPGFGSNYKDDLTMNHIYFTALKNGAGLAAALAKGQGAERVYLVEPTGPFENDPNVTNKKFPGNPTRSYRTSSHLKVLAEVTDFARQTAEERQKWKEKLENNKGEIIN